jgi:hypothetical protein
VRRSVPIACAVAVATSIAAAFAWSCQQPTEIVVIAQGTSGLCASGRPGHLGIFTSKPGDAPKPRASRDGCQEGDIGSLTLLPSDDGPDVDLVVAMAFGDKTAAACVNDPADCVVAKRRVTYQKNERLELRVALDRRCLGVRCDGEQTCFEGQCKSSRVDCTSNGCADPGDAGAPADGGPSDATVIVPDAAVENGCVVGRPIRTDVKMLGGIGVGVFWILTTDESAVQLEVDGGVFDAGAFPGALAITGNGDYLALRTATQIVHGNKSQPKTAVVAPVGDAGAMLAVNGASPHSVAFMRQTGATYVVEVQPEAVSLGAHPPDALLAAANLAVFVVDPGDNQSTITRALRDGGVFSMTHPARIEEIVAPSDELIIWTEGAGLWLGGPQTKTFGDRQSLLITEDAGKPTHLALANGSRDLFYVVGKTLRFRLVTPGLLTPQIGPHVDFVTDLPPVAALVVTKRVNGTRCAYVLEQGTNNLHGFNVTADAGP